MTRPVRRQAAEPLAWWQAALLYGGTFATGFGLACWFGQSVLL